jgi:hypothetical protein
MTSRYCTKAVGRGLEHIIVTSSTSRSPIQEISDTSKRFKEPEKKKVKKTKNNQNQEGLGISKHLMARQ